jgi:flavin-dependent dehydrogenase
LLRQWFSPPIADRVHNLRLTRNYETPKITKTLARPILLLDRSRFDCQLIEAALEKGRGDISFRDGWPAERIEETKSGLRIHGPKHQSIRTGYLIGADGAGSIAARFLGSRPRAAAGYAIDASVTTTAGGMAPYRSTAEFNYGCVPSGYGWIFPKRDRLSCGIGSWRRPFPTRRELHDFLQRSLPAGSIRSVQMQSHPVPVWSGYRRLASGKVLLAGDAANLVDPITGEGIRFALLSGMLAAETILSVTRGAAERIRPALTESAKAAGGLAYERKVHHAIGREMEIRRLFALPVFLEAPDLFYRKFVLEGRDLAATYRNLAEKLNTRVEPISPMANS